MLLTNLALGISVSSRNDLSGSAHPSQDYSYLVKFASKLAVIIASILLISKLLAWWFSGSAAMLASSTDSLLDVFASITSFIIIRFSLTPADEQHRFGHGKAENLAALIQAAFVLGSASLLVFHGIDRFFNPQPIFHSSFAIGVSVLAILLTLVLVIVQKKVIAQTASAAISADSLHYQSDLFLNVGVILALVLSQFNFNQADGIFTILVGVYLIYGSVSIVYQSVQDLMDRELDNKDVEQIKKVLNTHPNVLGFHDLRTRQSGKMRFIQLHLELDDELTLFAAHSISEEVEDKILQLFDDTEVLIHQDPQSVVNKQTREFI